MMEIRYSRLGSPSSAGEYPVQYGSNTIYVSIDEDIIAVAQAWPGGNPRLHLSDCTSAMDEDKHYKVTRLAETAPAEKKE